MSKSLLIPLGIFIVLIVLCINFLGDGLRDALDPRSKVEGSKPPKQKSRAVKGVAVGSAETPGGDE